MAHGCDRESGLTVQRIEPVTLACRNRLSNMYTLSPFVWRSPDGGFEIMVRAVRRRDEEPRLKMAEIWHGYSRDGLHFDMDIAPTLFPGPDACDIDGCEDPTVLLHEQQLHVWYTGWDQTQMTGRLLYANGPDARHIRKRGVALASEFPYENPKEAAVVLGQDGRWRLFFEFAHERASRMGMAWATNLAGPWTIVGEVLERRAGHFDNWHLSPGPVLRVGSTNPLMFYNGANEQPHWRIGWVVFDANYRSIIARSAEPLIVPIAVGEGASDIAFAASAVEHGERIWLYYSVSDRALFRATIAATDVACS